VTVEGICFDLDGTLIRSEEIRDAVRRAYVADAGGKWTADAQREMTGMTLFEWAHYMHDRLGVPRDAALIVRELEARLEAVYEARLPLERGAREVLERCAERWPLALATGSPRRLMEIVLDRGNLRRYFRVTISVEEVGRGKPAPDVYLQAAKLLHADARRCVAVEDSDSGILSARAAGMRVVAITNSAVRAPRNLPLATVVLEHLTLLTPDVIAAAEGAP